jgi:hypothetical protein
MRNNTQYNTNIKQYKNTEYIKEKTNINSKKTNV